MPVLRRCGGSVSMRCSPNRMRPGIELAKARDHAQQRGLAAARRSEQREELAVAHRDRDIVDRAHGAEAARDAVDRDRGHANLRELSACAG